MKKVNSRNKKICIFCKYWLGDCPQVDYRTGDSKIDTVVGRCSLDETEQHHKADGLCSYFERDLIYM